LANILNINSDNYYAHYHYINRCSCTDFVFGICQTKGIDITGGYVGIGCKFGGNALSGMD